MLLSSCGQGRRNDTAQHIDSLNQRAYALRYSHVDSVRLLSKKVLQLAQGPDEHALNNLAYVAYQQMDYQGVDSLLNLVRETSHNQIALLCADVLQMKTAQRTSEGVSFFTAKRSAEKRIRRIEEERRDLDEQDEHLFRYAFSEMHIIASTYYYYQGQDSLAKHELALVRQIGLETLDPAQWIYYNYMMGSGGMVDAVDTRTRVLTEFDYLFTAYSYARWTRNLYFEANALQAIALLYEAHSELILRHRYSDYQMLEAQNMSWAVHDLALACMNHALALFQEYDDLFQTACVLRSRGELYFGRGLYTHAIADYSQALQCVNRHHLKYYGGADTLQMMDSSRPSTSVEAQWLKNAEIHTVPDWIAGIREQISMAFSAIGDKEASDFNRNAYLDILELTNQNAAYEDRSQELMAQSQTLWIRFALAFFSALLLSVLMSRYRRRLRRRSSALQARMQRLLAGEEITPELAACQERIEELEERMAMCRTNLASHKVSNVEKRAKVSLVHAVVPYLDRIRGELIRMKRSGKADSSRQAYIVELANEIERNNAILTDWIQMKQGELSLRISSFPLQRLFDIVQGGRYAFDQKRITLRVEATESRVKADEVLTLFMINTLADNARKFTPEGGEVQIRAIEREDYVEVQVQDTGCGLSEHDVELLNNNKVYDTSHIGAGNQEGKGFGFGLMNCRGIIEKYKKLSSLFACCAFGVESKEGRGSTFFFRLPRILGLLLVFWANSSMANPMALYDSVYQCNLEGRYAEAVLYGEGALKGVDERLLLCDSNTTSVPWEVEAWQQGVPLDYLLIRGVRNELALAALALNDWPLYRYNNRIYTQLQKFANEDPSLPEYCRKLEESHRNGRLLLVFSLLFIGAALTLAYKLFINRQLASGLDIEQKLVNWENEQMRLQEERIHQLEDAIAKTEYEENRLYVQNQVLDNCLSILKHESMYYPSRIRQLAERLNDEDIPDLDELVAYYHHIYTILCSQADKQVEQPGFKRQALSVSDLASMLQHLVLRWSKKQNREVRLNLEEMPEAKVWCDPVLMEVLLVQLVTYLFSTASRLEMRCSVQDRFADFALKNPTHTLDNEVLHQLFSASTSNIPLQIAKQVIREHDIYTGNPGLRLYAAAEGEGFTIHFTLLKQQ